MNDRPANPRGRQRCSTTPHRGVITKAIQSPRHQSSGPRVSQTAPSSLVRTGSRIAPSFIEEPEEDEDTPTMPFQIVSSGTSLDLSGSVYETSSGSNMDTSVGPARACGPIQEDMSSNLMKWEQYIQQNNLLVNIDPSMVESYVQARLDADRAHIEALALADNTQVRAEAAIAVGQMQTRAECAVGQI